MVERKWREREHRPSSKRSGKMSRELPANSSDSVDQGNNPDIHSARWFQPSRSSHRVAPIGLTLDTPIGPMWAEADDRGITRLTLASPDDRPAPTRCVTPIEIAARQHLVTLATQINEYFMGTRCEFGVSLHLRGTPFQLRVWSALRRIPFGETRTYSELAESLGTARAARAVGQANRRNPILLVIPCHRVVGGDGELGGFAWGVGVKRRLLEWERSCRGLGRR